MSHMPAMGDAETQIATAWPTIPGYEILAELGRGGMGVVYKARQVASGRLVALKLIRDGALAGPAELARFRIEAEAAARMRHASIVEIYEAGEHQGRQFLAMELVEGGSLDKRLASRPLPVEEAAALVRTLALAIQHAHDQQIVHRDLKPANILLAGELSAPKITDFGLAKRLDSESTAFTQAGAILGTAGYMAPEQAAGSSSDIGPAVDVYALGAILFELLTGRPPFRGDSWQQTIQQVLHEEPLPPTRLNPDAPRDLERVCLKCLAKEPAGRYARAAELADDLSRFLARQPVQAEAPSAIERLTRVAARDGYRIVGELGRGPRSVVYHALQEPLQQPIALKIFAAGLGTRAAWEDRLRQYSQVWRALAHPHIVAVRQTGWWDESPYFVQEYVPGGSLAGVVAGQPVPLRRALRLVSQLAEVVGYLHRQGVVHGNLKPSNVLLAADDIPRVADFRFIGGLADDGFSGDVPAGDRMATDDPRAIGLAYVPPELAEDPRAEPRPFSDIYGLGTVLYELLTGGPPFAGSTAREILEQVRSSEPPPPSSLNSEVTPALDACCLRCLHKNPWRRYHRAYDLARRLQHLAEHPDGRSLPGSRPPKRRMAGE